MQSLDYKAGDRQFLVVSTGKTMLPYVDQMIAALDYPSKKVDENGTAVSGDGITLLDATHYATEQVVLRPLAEYLTACCPDVRFAVGCGGDALCFTGGCRG